MSSTPKNQITYTGRLGDLYRIWIINILLAIITFNIHSFWGRTRLRQCVIGNCRLSENKLNYTGTGLELFIGFLKALVLLILLRILLGLPFFSPWIMAVIVVLFFLYGVYFSVYRSLKYRLSRITLKGVRFKLTGSAHQYSLMKLRFIFLNIITLGLSAFYADINLQKYVINNMYFGEKKFSFTRNKSVEVDLWQSHLITLLLAIPTLGLSRFWYSAQFQRYQYSQTQFDSLRFQATNTGERDLVFHFCNALIFIFTLGFGLPLVAQRQVEYFIDNSFILGDVNSSILSSHQLYTQKASAFGEGLEQTLGANEHELGNDMLGFDFGSGGGFF